jgi:AraC-like DNA-binding protein
VFGVGGKDYVMRPGDVFLTFPDEPHGSAGHPMERGSLYWFHVRAPRRGESLLGLSVEATAALHQALDEIETRCFQAGQIVGQALASAFAGTQQAFTQPTAPLGRLRICTPLVAALLGIVEAAGQQTSSRTGGRMQQAIDYMDAHVAERLTVDDIAAAVGLSPSWFKARFRREVGMPPAEYLLRRKVERAREMLANPSLSITRIAMRLGFSSSQHFAAVIRRYTGKTPRQCRDA